jgi:hypothetical protein
MDHRTTRAPGLGENTAGEGFNSRRIELERGADQALGQRDRDGEDALSIVLDAAPFGLAQGNPSRREIGVSLGADLLLRYRGGRYALFSRLGEDTLGLLVCFSNDTLGLQACFELLACDASLLLDAGSRCQKGNASRRRFTAKNACSRGASL